MASSSNPQTHPTPAVTTPSSASSAANSPAPRPAPRDDELDRQALEKSLNELAHSLLELGIMVHDFQPGTHVIDKINQVTNHYVTIDKIKDNISSLYVPEEVVKYVEEARNPDIFTQSFVERAAAENQFTNGKIQAIESFRSLLATEIASSFPDLGPMLSSPSGTSLPVNGVTPSAAAVPPHLFINGTSSSVSPASSMSTAASPLEGINGRH